MAGKVFFSVSMSLDGFIAGPSQSEQNPQGEDGLQLHEWIFESCSETAPDCSTTSGMPSSGSSALFFKNNPTIPHIEDVSYHETFISQAKD